VDVLGAQRVDRGGNHLDALHRQAGWHELGHREHGRVEALQAGREKAPSVGVRLARVDVAAPHPARLTLAVPLQQPDRLGVVNDDEVVVTVEGRGVLLVALAVGGLLGIGQRSWGAL
jgi:hypothetical protein